MIRCTLFLAISEFCRVRSHYHAEEFEEACPGVFIPRKGSDLRQFLEADVHKMLAYVGIKGLKSVRLFDETCVAEICLSQQICFAGLQSAKPIGSKSILKESPFDYLAKANPDTRVKIAEFMAKWRKHIEQQVTNPVKPKLTPGEMFDLEDAGWDLRITTWGEEMGHSKKLAKLNGLGTIVDQTNPEFSLEDHQPKKNFKETLDYFLETEITDYEEKLSLFFEPAERIKTAN